MPKRALRCIFISNIPAPYQLEFLNREKVEYFLLEVKRVLVPGGIIRIAVPALEVLVKDCIRREESGKKKRLMSFCSH